MNASAKEKHSYLVLGLSSLTIDSLEEDMKLDNSLFKSIEYSQDISDDWVVRGSFEFDDFSNTARQIFAQFFGPNYGMIVERGKISGNIKGNFASNTLQDQTRNFDGSYLSINFYNNTSLDGHTWGWNFSNYQLPTEIDYRINNRTNRYIDTEFNYYQFGFAIYYDPLLVLRRKLASGEVVEHSDWYFRSIANVLSLSLAKISNGFKDRLSGLGGSSGVNNDSFWGFNTSGHYELGWVWAFKYKDYKITSELSYMLRLHTNIFFSWFKDSDSMPAGDTNVGAEMLIMHGPQFKMSATF